MRSRSFDKPNPWITHIVMQGNRTIKYLDMPDKEARDFVKSEYSAHRNIKLVRGPNKRCPKTGSRIDRN